MKQQIFVVHGGNAYGTYEEYIAALQQKEVSLEDLKRTDWKSLLHKNLGDGFEVFTPRMPNGQNAKYEEWKIYFEKFLPLLDDGVIFVGHSLGGMFLAKYFSENKSSRKIKAILFVAAPGPDEEDQSLKEFAVSSDLALLRGQAKILHFYHSKDDKVVRFTNLEQFKKFIPEAVVNIFEDRGHFNQETFPEIVKDIQGM